MCSAHNQDCYSVPNFLAGPASLVALADPSAPVMELLTFVAVVSLLSSAGSIAYWTGKTWGWFVHLPSVLGQPLFPGSLFEFKFDLYHMKGWIALLISVVILVVMGMRIRTKRKKHSV